MELASGRKESMKVFGNDYNTPDGTCIRDYIHVVDLARAHRISLENIKNINKYTFYNVGTGNGVSVLDIVNTFINYL